MSQLDINTSEVFRRFASSDGLLDNAELVSAIHAAIGFNPRARAGGELMLRPYKESERRIDEREFRLLVRDLNSVHYTELATLFAKADVDGDGVIDRSKLKEILPQLLELGLTRAQARDAAEAITTTASSQQAHDKLRKDQAALRGRGMKPLKLLLDETARLAPRLAGSQRPPGAPVRLSSILITHCHTLSHIVTQNHTYHTISQKHM